MAVGDVYRLARTYYIDGVLNVNVMHFVETVATAFPEAALTAAWQGSGNVEAYAKQFQYGATSWVPGEITVQKIFPTQEDVESDPMSSSGLPTLVDGLPTFAQIGLRIDTALAGRSGRGGNFYSAVPENQTTGNNITPGYQSLIAQYIDRILDVFSSPGADFSGFEIGVWSPTRNEFNVATALSVGSQLGTMVSRRIGNGV